MICTGTCKRGILIIVLWRKSDSMEEKFGKVVFDGRLYDLDSMSSKDLMNLLNQIEKKEKDLTDQLDEMYKDDEHGDDENGRE